MRLECDIMRLGWFKLYINIYSGQFSSAHALCFRSWWKVWKLAPPRRETWLLMMFSWQMLSVLLLDVVTLSATRVAGATWEEESTRGTGFAVEEPPQIPIRDPVSITPPTQTTVIIHIMEIFDSRFKQCARGCDQIQFIETYRNVMPLIPLYITTALMSSNEEIHSNQFTFVLLTKIHF